jgi:asparagine N-glycosylation enzyme membrane subunit Stt3
MNYRNAGGTEGGSMQFLLGVVMMIGGGYLLLSEIVVQTPFGFGRALYNFGGVPITTGMVLIPLMFGIGMIFYNSRNWLGWLLGIGSLIAMVFGVIANIQIRMSTMSAFDLIVILVLLVGGIGLFLSSLRSAKRS